VIVAVRRYPNDPEHFVLADVVAAAELAQLFACERLDCDHGLVMAYPATHD
jgi:hypothetical protein